LTPTQYALIVAGGKGTRFKSPVPKQFLELHGKPVLLHTLEAFYRYSDAIRIILVLPEDQIPTWVTIAKKYAFIQPIIVQAGGDTRFHSVRRGLERIQGDGLVAIHDGVRPLVSTHLISESFRYAALHQSAICAVPLKESLRMIGHSSDAAEKNSDRQQSSKAVDRSNYRLVQTPQTFQVSLIREAYLGEEKPNSTDDATVFERAGHTVFLFEGSFDNIKITTPEDLLLADALLRARGV
jgi:2-C-methyl-D-erythritol 4-phosphate cytidylyltransferase